MSLARVSVVVVALCGAGALEIMWSRPVGGVESIYADMRVSGPQPARLMFALRPVSSAIVVMAVAFAVIASRRGRSVSALIVLQISIGAAYVLAFWQAARLLSH